MQQMDSFTYIVYILKHVILLMLYVLILSLERYQTFSTIIRKSTQLANPLSAYELSTTVSHKHNN